MRGHAPSVKQRGVQTTTSLRLAWHLGNAAHVHLLRSIARLVISVYCGSGAANRDKAVSLPTVASTTVRLFNYANALPLHLLHKHHSASGVQSIHHVRICLRR